MKLERKRTIKPKINGRKEMIKKIKISLIEMKIRSTNPKVGSL